MFAHRDKKLLQSLPVGSAGAGSLEELGKRDCSGNPADFKGLVWHRTGRQRRKQRQGWLQELLRAPAPAPGCMRECRNASTQVVWKIPTEKPGHGMPRRAGSWRWIKGWGWGRGCCRWQEPARRAHPKGTITPNPPASAEPQTSIFQHLVTFWTRGLSPEGSPRGYIFPPNPLSSTPLNWDALGTAS